MDIINVLGNLRSGLAQLDEETRDKYPKDRRDEIPGVFSLMAPIDGSVVTFQILSQSFDTYILSTAPWDNPSAWSDKLLWVQTHLGELARKRPILTHYKNLSRGDFLVDNRVKNVADCFTGEHIHFGKEKFS